jgi:hypothetical protein
MLNFALAELCERRNQNPEAETVLRTHIDKSYADLLKVESMIPPEGTNKEEEANSASGETAALNIIPGNVAAESQNSQNTQNSQNGSSSEGKKTHPMRNLLQLRIREVGQSWIVFLRFAWRAKGYQEMRSVFKEARTDEDRYPSRFLDWRVWDFAGASFFCMKV